MQPLDRFTSDAQGAGTFWGREFPYFVMGVSLDVIGTIGHIGHVPIKTNQLWGYPHDFGNIHVCFCGWFFQQLSTAEKNFRPSWRMNRLCHLALDVGLK